MAFETSARARLALIGLAAGGMLGVSASSASAQYYYGGYPYDYSRPYYGGYGYSYPPPQADISQRAINRIATRNHGLTRIERTTRTDESYLVDGERADGTRLRLIFDRDTGELLERITLKKARPRVANPDPRDEVPISRLTPHPPERPSAIRPPAEASAPATIVPSVPAAPPRAPEPVRQVPAPAEAKAPATEPLKPAVVPAVPTQGSVNPETGAPKPILVNPNDVRGTGGDERKPPMATVQPSAPEASAIKLPSVQAEDSAPSVPAPQTPAVPVAPLD